MMGAMKKDDVDWEVRLAELRALKAGKKRSQCPAWLGWSLVLLPVVLLGYGAMVSRCSGPKVEPPPPGFVRGADGYLHLKEGLPTGYAAAVGEMVELTQDCPAVGPGRRVVLPAGVRGRVVGSSGVYPKTELNIYLQSTRQTWWVPAGSCEVLR